MPRVYKIMVRVSNGSTLSCVAQAAHGSRGTQAQWQILPRIDRNALWLVSGNALLASRPPHWVFIEMAMPQKVSERANRIAKMSHSLALKSLKGNANGRKPDQADFPTRR